MRLSARLKMLSDMVDDGAVVADIGTDHAYLPLYLIATGKCPSAVASDLREGPLMNAVANAAALSLSSRIDLRISDGLAAISPDDADCFIFAGMGGNLIVDILSKADWIKNPYKSYIFQPMTHAELVRAYLLSMGFYITEENACFDECKPYIAFKAKYDPTHKRKYKKSYVWMGDLDTVKNEAAAYYLTKQHTYLKQRADALERANLLPDEVKTIREILPDIEPHIRKIRKG